MAARLEEEGVGDPDAVLSDLVEEFAGAQEGQGVHEGIFSAHNERTATAEDDQALAAVEQRTAMTPASGATEVGGAHSAVAALAWWVVLVGRPETFDRKPVAGGEWDACPRAWRWRCVPRRCSSASWHPRRVPG